jgi:hypothetical protein
MSGITIKLKSKGSFSNSISFLKRAKQMNWLKMLDSYAAEGVEALRAATPKDTGLTADSWAYEITNDGKALYVTWYNTNVKKDYFNVALMLQLGHATRGGTWINGVDYINPALKPVFDKIENNMWEVIHNT